MPSRRNHRTPQQPTESAPTPLISPPYEARHITTQSRAVRNGSWILYEGISDLAENNVQVYKYPRLLLTSRNMAKLVLEKFGKTDALRKYNNLLNAPAIPYVAAGFKEFPQVMDESLHFAFHPDDETTKLLREESRRIKSELGIDTTQDIETLTVASFALSDVEAINATRTALQEYLYKLSSGEPHLLFASPTISF